LWQEVLACCWRAGASEGAKRLVARQANASEQPSAVLFALASDDERGLSVWVGDPDDPLLHWAPRGDVMRCLLYCVERPHSPLRVDHLHGGDPARLMRGVRRRIDNALQAMQDGAPDLVERLQEGLTLRSAGLAVWAQYAGRPIRTDFRGPVEGPTGNLRGTNAAAPTAAADNVGEPFSGGIREQRTSINPHPGPDRGTSATDRRA